MSKQTHEHQSAHPQTPKLGPLGAKRKQHLQVLSRGLGVEPKCPGDLEPLLTALPLLMPRPSPMALATLSFSQLASLPFSAPC